MPLFTAAIALPAIAWPLLDQDRAVELVQSGHDLRAEQFDANLIHHLFKSVVLLLDAAHRESGILKEVGVTLHGLGIAMHAIHASNPSNSCGSTVSLVRSLMPTCPPDAARGRTL